MDSTDIQIEPAYVWNPAPRNGPRRLLGSRRVFHSAFSSCIRRGQKEKGDTPPEGYWPCYKCFPPCTKRLDAAFNAIVPRGDFDVGSNGR